jgi:hypothetical protein
MCITKRPKIHRNPLDTYWRTVSGKSEMNMWHFPHDQFHYPNSKVKHALIFPNLRWHSFALTYEVVNNRPNPNMCWVSGAIVRFPRPNTPHSHSLEQADPTFGFLANLCAELRGSRALCGIKSNSNVKLRDWAAQPCVVGVCLKPAWLSKSQTIVYLLWVILPHIWLGTGRLRCIMACSLHFAHRMPFRRMMDVNIHLARTMETWPGPNMFLPTFSQWAIMGP